MHMLIYSHVRTGTHVHTHVHTHVYTNIVKKNLEKKDGIYLFLLLETVV